MSNAVKLIADLFYNLNQARKLFLVGRFGEKIQKILKKLESTSWINHNYMTYLFQDIESHPIQPIQKKKNYLNK